MAGMSLPVTLQVGETVCEFGTIELPFTTMVVAPRSIAVRLDDTELRRRLAAMLREAADTLEEGPADGS